MAQTPPPILEVSDLRVEFGERSAWPHRGTLHAAVDGVSLAIPRGGSLGLVGESGCGKTTLGRAILRLIPAVSGTVRFDGIDVLSASRSALRSLRRRMQIVFQDPGSSLNPRMRIGDAVSEPLIVHGLVRGAPARSRAADMLRRCGLDADALDRYPHEFSGGQRQRIAIARALISGPEFLVLDEPTSALDVSVQAQILNLLTDLRREFGLSFLFISHDLAVVRGQCESIAVMQRGRIVETGPAAAVVDSPRDPYTRRLIDAVPEPVVHAPGAARVLSV